MGKRLPAALAALVAAAGLATAPPAVAVAAEPEIDAAGLPFDLDRADIPSLQRRMAAGELTATRLTSAYLARIRVLDPKVNAVLALNPAALAQAAASDVRHRTGRTRGPLDGIPVLVKDNVDTQDQQTTAGSRALRSRPAKDATLITRLRDAGAVILGKANLSEWANFRAAKPTSGWSGVGGQTNNPYVLDHNPCGSSAGSAAGVAASLAQVAIGSETDGSIVCPAGMTATVGHKPSLGLVSRTGVVPISAEQDTAGPIARNVVDTALTLSVLQGRDPSDPATLHYPSTQPTDYAKLLRPGVLRGARIGLWRLPVLGPDTDAVVSKTKASLERAGATVVEVTLPYQDRLSELEFPALLTEFHRDIDAYLATRPTGPRNLADLIAYNRADPLERTCFAGQELFEQALAAPGPNDPTYLKNRAELTDLSRRSLDETLAKYDLDAIASPTNPPAWKTDCAVGDNDVIPSSTPAAVAGYPDVTVPAGSVGPLPVGISFMGGQWSDGKMLALAADYMRVAPVRVPPRYLPRLPG
ncbi:amidase [Amycolatopsis echigonensis]|uniref:Amidase n=1 Tax=Amycolatopsis echigonensis TaxID=2576905 RepID=A0A2N3WCN0_9PSEU|nr:MULTISPECIES: amidase [Amycolatopsis]MBB2501060.1 amidase [Amycolatopsis echigonensis]PKV91631.1 amidase [Amycolatopsis niigatensis]